jgi:hypothetical protein
MSGEKGEFFVSLAVPIQKGSTTEEGASME